MESFQVKSNKRVDFIDITSQVRKSIKNSGITDGIALVYVTHTTAGVTINESADPAVAQDIISKLGEMVPLQGNYKHMEGNSDAHIKSSLVGSSVNLIISDAAPVLGTWQGVFFCEFDGPRTRKVVVKAIG